MLTKSVTAYAFIATAIKTLLGKFASQISSLRVNMTYSRG